MPIPNLSSPISNYLTNYFPNGIILPHYETLPPLHCLHLRHDHARRRTCRGTTHRQRLRHQQHRLGKHYRTHPHLSHPRIFHRRQMGRCQPNSRRNVSRAGMASCHHSVPPLRSAQMGNQEQPAVAPISLGFSFRVPQSAGPSFRQALGLPRRLARDRRPTSPNPTPSVAVPGSGMAWTLSTMIAESPLASPVS